MANRNKYGSFFTPSGCLKLETFQLYETSSLTSQENEIIKKHLTECDLCSDALEGFKQIEQPEKLSATINELNENLNNISAVLASANSRTIHISKRILYFSAAASVLILAGFFAYLKFDKPMANKEISAALQEKLTDIIPPTPAPKIALNAQADSDKNSEQEGKSIAETLPEIDKIILPGSKKGKENRMPEKIIPPPEHKFVQENTFDKGAQSISVKNKEVQPLEEEPVESEAIEVASNQPVDYYLGEIIIHSEKAKKKSSAIKVQVDKNKAKVIGGVEIEKGKNQDQAVGLISRDETNGNSKNTSYQSAPAANTQNSDHFFNAVDSMPEFPGGNPAMTDFLEKNIHYPSYAMDNRIEGTLYISFIIEETGKISSVNVLRGIGGRCDEEAARAVNSMPDWSPAYLNGQPIRVRFNMPITFKLN